MSYEVKVLLGYPIVVFAFVLMCSGALHWLDYSTCYANLEIRRLEGTWGPLIRCQVKMSDGNYIPYSRWVGMEQIELRRK
jgi:hypothetical protein